MPVALPISRASESSSSCSSPPSLDPHHTQICHSARPECSRRERSPRSEEPLFAFAFKQFGVAFSTGPAKLAPMNFTAYSYWWRFTCRTSRKRGAAV